jgi:hypothetical protein
MQVTGVYAAQFSVSISSVTVSSRATNASPSAGPSKGAPRDTVQVGAYAEKIAQGQAADGAGAPAPPAKAVESDDRADALWHALDANGDGRVTRREFMHGARELLGDEAPSRSTLRRLFRALDRDRDGGVERGELAASLERLDRRRAHAPKEKPAADAAGSSGTSRTATLTIVSVAIQRYTAIATSPS